MREFFVGGPTGQGFVMQSTDGGQTWSDSAQIASQPLYAVRYIDANTAVAVGNNGSIVQTTDGGANWNTQSTPAGAFRPLRGMSVIGNTVFAAGDTTVIVSTNGGTNWTRKRTNLNSIIYPQQLLYDIAMASATNGWAVGATGIVYNTRDGGTTWTFQKSPYLSHDIYGISAVDGLVVYVGQAGTIVRNSTPVMTAVGDPIEFAPPRFSLMQNYPNPFNPSTTIRYELPHASYVSLKVYNLLGQEVKTLVSGYQVAGVKTVEFNASGLSSGVYLYRITAGSLTDVKKFMLVK